MGCRGVSTPANEARTLSIVYVSDLDGTLLRGNTTLSAFSRYTLNALLDGGLQFTVASARSVASMRPILEGLRLTLPVVEFNGAFITDLYTGEHAIVHSLPREDLDSVGAIDDRHGCVAFLSTFDSDQGSRHQESAGQDGSERLRAGSFR